MQRFSQETQDITDLGAVSSTLVRVVPQAMQAERVALLLPAPQGGDFVVAADSLGDGSPLTLPGKGALASWLLRQEGALTSEKLDTDPVLQALPAAERESLARAGARLLVPLKAKGELTGLILLGQKLTDLDYSREDLELLETVARQAAMGVENSRLYTQEMERLRELESLGRLKSTLQLTVAHELKTPITAIRTAVDLLAEEASAQQTGRHSGRLISIVHRGVDRLQRLVQESLDYAQMQSASLQLSLQPTDMKQLFREVASFMGPAFRGKKQALELDLPESVPIVLVDQTRIGRVLLNLLTNANKFTPVGGR